MLDDRLTRELTTSQIHMGQMNKFKSLILNQSRCQAPSLVPLAASSSLEANSSLPAWTLQDNDQSSDEEISGMDADEQAEPHGISSRLVAALLALSEHLLRVLIF